LLSRTARCIILWYERSSLTPLDPPFFPTLGYDAGVRADHTEVTFIDKVNGVRTFRLNGDTKLTGPFALSPNGQMLASGHMDFSVKLWDAAKGGCTRSLEGHDGWLVLVRFSPDGSLLATAAGHSARVWDVSTGACVAEFSFGGAPIDKAVFSPCGRRIVFETASQLHLCDITNSADLCTLESVRGQWAFSPQGDLLASESQTSSVGIWDAASGEALHVLRDNSGPILAIEWSRDGKTLVTAGQDATARVWDIQEGTCLAVLEGHASPFSYASFSPEGDRVVTTSLWAKNLCIWDARTGACLGELEDSDRLPLIDAVFSDDGWLLFVNDGADRTLRLYRRRRPEWWWGVAWLWEFWLTVALAAAFVWSVLRDRKALARQGGTPR